MMNNNVERALENAMVVASTNQEKGGIIPFDQNDVFCIVPVGENTITLFGKKTEDGIFLTEEDLSNKEVYTAIFSDTDFKLGKSFKDEEIEEIMDVDPILLLDLYELIDTITCDQESVMPVIKVLIRDGGYHPEEIIQNLLKMGKTDLEKLVEEEDVISAYQEIRY